MAAGKFDYMPVPGYNSGLAFDEQPACQDETAWILKQSLRARI
jgi:hypothetical protein